VPNAHAQFDGGLDDDLHDRVETLGAELVSYADVASLPEARPAGAAAAED
jgi:hypothetical protein